MGLARARGEPADQVAEEAGAGQDAAEQRQPRSRSLGLRSCRILYALSSGARMQIGFSVSAASVV